MTVTTRRGTKAPHTFEMELDADKAQVRRVRELVDKGAEAWELDGSTRFDAQLVLTELFSNAARLYEGSALRIWISNPLGSAALDVHVWDPDPTKGPMRLAAFEGSITGRGMVLVSQFTHGRWGWRKTTDPVGKVVWGRVSP